MTGAELIAAERRRQVQWEGYDVWEDSVMDEAELAIAAWCYLGDYTDQADYPLTDAPAEWPWRHDDGLRTWKPTPDDPVRQLVKAGALVAAEIDRLLALAAERGPADAPAVASEGRAGLLGPDVAGRPDRAMPAEGTPKCTSRETAGPARVDWTPDGGRTPDGVPTGHTEPLACEAS